MKFNKTDIVRQYRDRYPDLPNLTLAKVIYKKESKLFSSVEAVRTALRGIEGKGSKTTKVTHKTPNRPLNPWNLPETYQDKREPLKLPKLCNNILMLSDIHVPYHDIEALTAAIDYGVKEKVNTVFINGDLVDFHKLSKYEKDPRKRNTKDEIDAAIELLTAIRKALPNASIYWLYGNHDIRYQSWLRTKCLEIYDDEYYHLHERMQLNKIGVQWIDDKILVKAGKLSITHGHHIFKGVFSPVSPARGAFMRAKQSIIVGHLHRPSHHPETTLDGKVISSWSTGCLCELRPDYSPLVSNSMHGFAHVTVENNGEYHVRNYQIVDGKIY